MEESTLNSSLAQQQGDSSTLSQEALSRMEREKKLKRVKNRKALRAKSMVLEEGEYGDMTDESSEQCSDTEPEAEQTAAAAPAEEPSSPQSPPSPGAKSTLPRPELTSEEKEKIAIGVEELDKVISGVPILDFLRARLASSVDKGIDFLTLIGFYRIASRMLKEEFEKKRDLHRKVELEYEEQKKEIESLRNQQAIDPFKPQPAMQQKPPERPPERPQERPPDRNLVDLQEAHNQEIFLLRETIKKKEQKINEFNDLYERLKTDFNNFRNRSVKEVDFQVDRSFEDLVSKFLPVVDNFERAVKASKTTQDTASLMQGVAMILSQFEEILKGIGVDPIKAEGQPFDPKIHEAIAVVENSEYPEDTVIEEVYRGYTIKKKILRPAMVKVSKRGAAPPPGPSA
ncbi:MAG: nucleotide exchange factor GrpE [Candidatus Eremiobacteraeota bacterium]|nr:nucleotide exchange factor GrpE [Candidatus Eremiobacteraeota bacterium]